MLIDEEKNETTNVILQKDAKSTMEATMYFLIKSGEKATWAYDPNERECCGLLLNYISQNSMKCKMHFFFQKMQHIRKSLVENRLSPCNRKNVLRLDKPRPCIKTITHEIAILTCTTLGRLFTFPCSYVRKSDPVCIYFSVIARLISAESNYTMPDPDIEVTITILTNSRDNAFIH